uniref:ABC transporter domain-containing protein n=2 Tax=Trichobilharzia regenti TaxID=157069 RepID=A0AA85JXC0_TRIRE|nr:unnamed protein product [Trichobilharzia regenti]
MEDLKYQTAKRQMSKSKQFLTHYRLLMWKNYLLRKRRPGFLFAEIFVPFIIPVILAVIRVESPPKPEDVCHVRSTNLPTMGLFSYIQSVVCNFLFRCHSTDPDTIYEQFNYSGFGNLLENISTVFEDYYFMKNITEGLSNFSMNKFVQIIKNSDDRILDKITILTSNIQQLYQKTYDGFYAQNESIPQNTTTDYDDLSNRTIDFGPLSISAKQIQWLLNTSQFICGTKTPDSNDIGKLMEFLKDANFSNILELGEKLKRIRREAPVLTSPSVNQLGTNFYRVNCSTIDSILRNPLLSRYTGRIRFILYGYIFYHPVNQWTSEIIYRALEPQRLLILLKNTLKQYETHTAPMLIQLLTNTSYTYQLRSILKECSTNSGNIIPVNIKTLCLKAWSWLDPAIPNQSSSSGYFSHWSIIFNQISVIFDIIVQVLDCFPLNAHTYGVSSRSDFDNYMGYFKSRVHPVVQGILFNNTGSDSSSSFSITPNSSTIITIRQSPLLTDETNDFKVLDHTWNPKPRNDVDGGDTKYFTSGYLDIQDLISNAIIELLNNLPERMERAFTEYDLSSTAGAAAAASSSSQSTAYLLSPGKQMKFFPTASYSNDIFLNDISKLLPQLILLTWILTAMLTTKFIIEEKENHTKEFTAIMGFTNFMHWFAWFSGIFFIALPVTIIISVILKYGNIIILSNIFIIICLFLSYIISIIMFSFLCSTLFKQANLGAIVTGMFYFIIYLPTPLILANEKLISETVIFIASLSNQVAFCLGFYSLTRSESQGFGSQWNDLWQPKFSDTLFSPGKSFLMLWIDSIVYFIIALLIELIQSKKYNYNNSQKWLNSALKCHCPWKLSKENYQYDESKSSDPVTTNTKEDVSNSNTCIESNSERLPVGIFVKDLSKVYAKNAEPALDKLSVNFYANQITSLLGHNGAGKSTLISILTGMHKPTNGSAMIAGYSVLDQMNTIRSNLGFCPQHNILFDYLTVIEHIQFYAYLKGFNKHQVELEVEYFARLLGFTNKLNDQVKKLSGGQKRKLSVAIAFVGGASVILLDEPTTGVDPYSRRSIWDLILKARLNKTIILTTHHMDEADILGDRIAIISQGKLKCYGSSLFLKSNYGQGYYLILERGSYKLSDENSTDSFQTEILMDEEFEKIVSYLQQFIDDIKLIDFSQHEIVFQIPMHNAADGSLSRMFRYFEENKSINEHISVPDKLYECGIISYGLTDTSLEEIFLAIADDPAMLSSPSPSPSRSIANLYDDTGTIPPVETNYNDNESNKNVNYAELNQPIKHDYLVRRKSQMNILRQSHRLLHFTDGGQLPTPPTSLSLLHRKHYYRTVNLPSSSSSSSPSAAVAAAGATATEEETNTNSRDFIQNVTTSIELNQPNIAQQIKSMFIKRFHHSKRSKLSLFIEFLLPICVLILALASSQLFKKFKAYQPMILSPWLMSKGSNPPQTLYTFYENNLYELNTPTESLINSTETLKSILGLSWRYENALKQPYGWTSIGCLPESTLNDMRKYYTLFGQCDQSNIRMIKKELSMGEINITRFKQAKDCLGEFKCPLYEQPSCSRLSTTDILLNLTSFNVSNYLLKTQNEYIRRRYGGLSYHMHNYPTSLKHLNHLLHPENTLMLFLNNLTGFYNFNNTLIKPDNFWSDFTQFIRLSLPPISYFRIWFNNKGYAASPAYLNALHNLQLRMLMNNQTAGLHERNQSHGIVFINYPLTLPKGYVGRGLPKELLFDLTLSIFTLLSLSFIPASFITFLVKEKSTGSKHLQYVSGLNPYVYWLSVYLWDILNYALCAFLCILVFIAFQKVAYIDLEVIGSFILLILLYGLAVTPMLYVTTFFIQSPSTALVILSIFNLLTGSITVVCTLILDDFSRNKPTIEFISNILKIIFTLFPQYCLTRGLFDLARRYYTLEIIQSITFGGLTKSSQIASTFATNPYDWSLLGSKICALPIEACVFFSLVLLRERHFFIQSIKDYFHSHYPKLLQVHNMKFIRKLSRMKSLRSIASAENDSEDEDVKAERLRVEKAYKSGQINAIYSVAIINLTKFFPLKNKPSVNSLTFAVRPAECFGLLGVNGAGKTTTFKMITGDLHPSMGSVIVNGFNVVTQTKNAHKSLGYCPQFDAVHELLTGRETLSLYARLRGFPEKEIPMNVTQMLQNMGLSPYADRIASAYSGGNRRKLSTAIAIIGKPQVILLDEPTSGMDPVGRRFMWDQIIALVKEGRSVILTSHSMEECEALCQRIGIMINGQLKCFGSIQHLKNCFGNGYTVEIRITPLASDDAINKLKVDFQRKFPTSTVNEIQTRYYEYQMGKDIRLSELLTFLKDMQDDSIIEHYSVKQTTLDQVFVNFSRDQIQTTERVDQM